MTLPQGALFGRSFRVTLQDKEFGSVNVERPLTFSFSVQRDKTITPNNVNILLYNLSEETRSHLEQLSGGFGQGTGKSTAQKLHSDRVRASRDTAHTHGKTKAGVAQASDEFGVTVRLEAGYGDSPGQLFFGVLRKVSSWQDGQNAAWLTQISGGDGEHSIATAKLSKTFVKGTPVTSVVRALVGALPGVGAGSLNATLLALSTGGLLSGGTKLQTPLTIHGDVATALEDVLRSCGYEWSIQDGAFYAGAVGEPTLPGDGPVLTPETGLLGTPQIDKNGKLVGKCLLQPDLIPGKVFRVESSRVTGNYICIKTQHKGDTTGEEWTTEFVGSPPAKNSPAALLAAALGDSGFTQ